jgi:hypothetical protein
MEILPLKFDISHLSLGSVVDLLTPVLPGGLIVVGWVYSHPAFRSGILRDLITKASVLLFIAYCLGLALTLLSSFILVALAVRGTGIPASDEVWKEMEWRKLAHEFLGEKLSPPLVRSMLQLPFISANAAPEDFEKASKERAERAESMKIDGEWYKWYQILREYFPEPPSASDLEGQKLIVVVYALGWAGLTGMYLSGKPHWLIWTICGLIIGACSVYGFKFMYKADNDPGGYKLSAKLLASIKGQRL